MERFPLRVLVALDRPTPRDTLFPALERAGLEIVGVAFDATEAIAIARRTSPDVALVDVHVPGGAVTATEGIVGSVEGCRVLALSGFGDGAAILQMLLTGAAGYLPRGTPSDALLPIVQRATRAQSGLSVDAVTSLMGDLLREIVDLSETKEKLRRSEERFRSLLEAAPDGVVIVNRRGEIVLVNQRTELMFGCARGDLLGRPMEFLVPERSHASHIAHRQAYLSEPRTRRMGKVPGLAGRRMNATEFPVDISLSTFESDGEMLIIAFVRDLSEREPPAADERSDAGVVDDIGAPDRLVIDLAGAREEERTSTLE